MEQLGGSLSEPMHPLQDPQASSSFTPGGARFNVNEGEESEHDADD